MTLPEESDAQFERFVITGAPPHAHELEKTIFERLACCDYSREAIFAIRLAYQEAKTNAIKHGNCGDQCKCVTVEFSIDEKRVVFRITDEGPGFNPNDVPDPTQPDRISLPSGRGLMLIQAYMDEVRFDEQGKSITMVKINR